MRVRLVIRRLRVRPPPVRQHSFVEIDHNFFSTDILFLPLIQERQLSGFWRMNVHNTGYPLSGLSLPSKSVVMLTDRAQQVYWAVKPQNNNNLFCQIETLNRNKKQNNNRSILIIKNKTKQTKVKRKTIMK